jgi:RNA polymerase sigma-70 factor, ECF subfamily
MKDTHWHGADVTDQADRNLLDGIRAGRREDCARLIHDHYQAIYRFLLHLTRSEAEAEDATQETFTAAWQKIAAFEGRSSLRTWLHRIAYGKFVDGRRAGRRSAALVEGLKTRGAPMPPDPLQAAANDDETRHLYAVLDQVEPGDRVLLVLHYLQGLSYREMADVTGEPAGTVKWRTSLALSRMRTLLTAEKSHVRLSAGERRDA